MALPTGELEALQAAMLETLPLSADIQRNPNIGNPVKGTIPDDWPTLASAVKCGMRQPTASELAQYATLVASRQSTVFTFSDGQDVKKQDRVIVSGTTWTVATPLTPQSYSVSTQVLATRLV